MGPTEVAFEQHGEVVGECSEAQSRFGGPERFEAEAAHGEAVLQFLDDVLAVRSAVVIAPDVQRACGSGQTRDQRLEVISGYVDQLFAAGLWPLGDAMPDQ